MLKCEFFEPVNYLVSLICLLYKSFYSNKASMFHNFQLEQLSIARNERTDVCHRLYNIKTFTQQRAGQKL